MEQQQTLEEVARRYREEGYRVLVRPRSADLPPFLAPFEPDILASKDSEKVVVEVKRREELEENHDLQHLAALVNAQPGWRFDLVVTNPQIWPDEVPRTVAEPGAAEINALREEASRLITLGMLKPAQVIASAALEAAMRTDARRQSITLDRYYPGFVLETLYSEGAFSHQEYERLRNAFAVRNAIVHGLTPAVLQPDTPKALVDAAGKLLECEPAAADS
jgi:hypothetical protein